MDSLIASGRAALRSTGSQVSPRWLQQSSDRSFAAHLWGSLVNDRPRQASITLFLLISMNCAAPDIQIWRRTSIVLERQIAPRLTRTKGNNLVLRQSGTVQP